MNSRWNSMRIWACHTKARQRSASQPKALLSHCETGLGSCVAVNQIGSGMYVELSLVFAKGKSVCFYLLSVLVTRGYARGFQPSRTESGLTLTIPNLSDTAILYEAVCNTFGSLISSFPWWLAPVLTLMTRENLVALMIQSLRALQR